MMKRLKKLGSIEVSRQWVKINPAQTLSLGFFFLIILGTLLLMLPFATKDRHWYVNTKLDNFFKVFIFIFNRA
jgi:trk system potassium uptake protein